MAIQNITNELMGLQAPGSIESFLTGSVAAAKASMIEGRHLGSKLSFVSSSTMSDSGILGSSQPFWIAVRTMTSNNMS